MTWTAVALATAVPADAGDELAAPVDRYGRPIATATERTVLYDEAGRIVRDTRGERINYRDDVIKVTPEPARRAAESTGDPLPGLKHDAAIDLEWHRAIYGVGIGDSGLEVADLDGDGQAEIVAAAGPYGFFKNNFWYVLSYDGGGYPQRWASAPYTGTITSLLTADLDGDGDEEVLVGVGAKVAIYDGLDPIEVGSINTAAAQILGLNAVDVDGDGQLELVFCDSSKLFVYDLATGALEYQGVGQGGKDVAVGNVDLDAGLEIVVANDTQAGYVLDGSTRAVEWTNPAGFGRFVRLGDVDADGRDEIVAGYFVNDVQVYDAELQTVAYVIPVDYDLDALQLVDVEGDGLLEIAYGDAQWGDLYLYDGQSGTLLWSEPNPEHGVTDLAVADVDGDGTAELLWGAGFSSSSADYLYVVDTFSLTTEWQSTDITGPFRALDYGDVDGDGEPELLYGSFESESGYDDGLFFVHDALTKELEYASGTTGSNWTGLWRIRHADVDADPQAEVFVTTSTTYTGTIIVYDGATWAEEWRLAIESGLTFLAMDVADVDGDGASEIVAATGREHTGASGVYLYVFDAATGALEWRSPSFGTGFVSYPLLRVADVDADAALEMVVARDGGELRIFDGVTHVEELLTADLDVTALDTPDRDGDGVAEVVIGTTAGYLRVLDPATGAVIETIGSYGSRINGLAVADLDLDGSADYVFGLASAVQVRAGAGGALIWTSGNVGSSVGSLDSLLVGDVDGDSALEIVVNLGETGVRVYQVDADDPPVVTITAPTDGTLTTLGDAVAFAGTAIDPESGDLSADLAWSSDVDGLIGSGASFSTAALSQGVHTITATVTDDCGLTGVASITLRVLSLPVQLTLTSLGAEDGWVLESNENSGVGGSANSGGSGKRAIRFGDASGDRQYKTILSFDTSSIPDGALVTAATLRLQRGRLTGSNPFNTHGAAQVDVHAGGFGGSTALAASDFQAPATAAAVAALSAPASDGDWSEGDLDGAGCAAVNLTGKTQLRVAFEIDDNDDGNDDYMGYYSGDENNSSRHPQLVVTYQE